MIFSNLSRKTQIILLAVGIVAVLHLYRQWLYQPIQKQLRRLKQEKVELSGRLPLLEGQKTEFDRLNELYKRKFDEFTQAEAEVAETEGSLPSQSAMAGLLEQLTKALDETKAQFVSLEPTLKKASETDPFDGIEIDVRFYGSYAQVIDYLKRIEAKSILIGVQKIQMTLDQEVSKQPMVAIRFSTFLSSRALKKEEKIKPVEMTAPEPFHPESKPFDNRLSGNHKLTMIIWNVSKPVALIDGKVMKIGASLDNKTLVQIDSDGVWFSENSIRYYLALEK